MKAPSNRNWQALAEQLAVGSAEFKLTVSGEVETANGGVEPILTEANPQGKHSNILVLDLRLGGLGAGTGDVAYRPATYSPKETIAFDQYQSVDIYWEHQSIASARVLLKTLD